MYQEQKLHLFLVPQGQAKTVEYPMVAVFPPGLSVTLAQLLKAPSFPVFLVIIFAKIWHPFLYFVLATISLK